MVWQIFTARKSFSDPVIGSVWANRAGLQILRMRLSDAFLAVRRWWLFRGRLNDDMRRFRRDGYVALTSLLADEDYRSLKASALAAMRVADQQTPVPDYQDAGFGKPHVYEWGFDRCDGSTVNRFYTLSDAVLIDHLSENQRFRRLVEYAAGCRFESRRLLLYRLLPGADPHRPDNQCQIHRDTFHSCVKFWFSLSAVTSDDGPLHYLPGSHRLNRARQDWEQQQSVKASLTGKGGAFRCSAEDVRQQYGAVPTAIEVPENTLVIADVRGWHRRGVVSAGMASDGLASGCMASGCMENDGVNQGRPERLAVYGSFRPTPFGLPRVRPLNRHGL